MKKKINYLALGDSYTKGEAVLKHESFPQQLVTKLKENYSIETSVKVIAKTGWRSDELIEAIVEENQKGNLVTQFDLITLLIGVNNQYQNKSFYQFKNEFIQLVQLAKKYATDTSVIRVLSIPDYAFTPFGKGNKATSEQLEDYNTYIKLIAVQEGIVFINITDITQQGLSDNKWVAQDDLHVSALAYKEFVYRILKSLDFLN